MRGARRMTRAEAVARLVKVQERIRLLDQLVSHGWGIDTAELLALLQERQELEKAHGFRPWAKTRRTMAWFDGEEVVA